jgi:hypothetical protein
MKNKFLIIPILLSLFAHPLLSKTTITLNEFNGGSFSFNLGFNADWMYGSRGDALRMGGAMSTLDNTPSFTSYNPAVLCYLKSGTASMGFVPVSIISSDVFYGMAKSFAGNQLKGNTFNDFLKGTVNDALNGSNGPLKDITIAPGVTTNVDNVDASFGQTTGLMGFEIMAPFAKGQAAFAFARENKASVDLSMMLTGLDALVNVKDPSQPLLNIDMRAKLNAVLNFRADNIVTSFGVGRKLTPEWGVGCVAEHYDSQFLLDGKAEADGTATYSGTTMSFNTNPGNSLEQSANADINGEAWGLRFGTSYHFLKDSIELGADVSVQPQINYRGTPEVMMHTIPDTIDLSDFTKTQLQPITITSGSLQLKLPSFIRLTAAFKGSAVINYTHYFDSYRLKYNNGTDNMEFDLQMMDSANLGFNFGVFQIGAGAIYTRVYEKTNGVQKNIAWLAIPMFSTGAVIPIGDYLKWEIDLFVFPMSVLKTAITYTFL